MGVKEQHVRERASFELIRYANCWEDADILCEALAPTTGKRVLSIASAGDNAFAIAAEGAEVVAVDLSPAQLALCELKKAAIVRLSQSELLGFLGMTDATDRSERYRELRKDLPESARAYWDASEHLIDSGVVHAGKFERYFELFRKRMLPLIHGKRRIRALLEQRGLEERKRFYRDKWNNRRWQGVFRLFFSRTVMGWLGRDPEFFRYVDGPVSTRILSRAEYALTELPTHDNAYLEYILTGQFAQALPRYIRPEHYEKTREGAGRVSFHHGSIEEVARQKPGFDGHNLSDIFEYLDEELTESVYKGLLEVSNEGARFAYWNMLVPRKVPDALAARVTPLADLSQKLFAEDRAFFYSAFVVEQVTGGDVGT